MALNLKFAAILYRQEESSRRETRNPDSLREATTCAPANMSIFGNHDYRVAMFGTVFMPLLALAANYAFRYRAERGITKEKLLQQTGPDCWLLSLGATGAIYVDPHVSSAPFVGGTPFALAFVLALVVLRFLSMKTKRKPDRGKDGWELQMGILSLVSVSSIISFAYYISGAK